MLSIDFLVAIVYHDVPHIYIMIKETWISSPPYNCFMCPDYDSWVPRIAGADLGGGSGGCNPPPNGQNHSIKCSTTNVLRYAQALIYIAKSLVVVVVSSKRVVKPLSRQAVVQPEVLHLLECLLGHSTVLGLGSSR